MRHVMRHVVETRPKVIFLLLETRSSYSMSTPSEKATRCEKMTMREEATGREEMKICHACREAFLPIETGSESEGVDTEMHCKGCVERAYVTQLVSRCFEPEGVSNPSTAREISIALQRIACRPMATMWHGVWCIDPTKTSFGITQTCVECGGTFPDITLASDAKQVIDRYRKGYRCWECS